MEHFLEVMGIQMSKLIHGKFQLVCEEYLIIIFPGFTGSHFIGFRKNNKNEKTISNINYGFIIWMLIDNKPK